MRIIPAIDLYQGKVVRLLKGDPCNSIVYSDNPIEIAKKFKDQGASLLHLVDLSAALGQGDNIELIKNILSRVSIDVEIGGGIRDLEKAKKLISWGAKRIIIGTKGLDEDFLNSLITEIGTDRIAIGVDVINSCLAINGWQTQTDFSGLDFIAYLQLKGIKWIIYTDISRDGTLEGLNCADSDNLAVFKDMNIILSGGVSSEDDFKKVKEKMPFVWGVVVGKALYEEKIDLKNINIDNF